jgi:hypothetical protein
MGLRFNPPPGWPPAPEGFAPPPGWRPDPAWPPAPAGWQLWVSDDTAPDDTAAYAQPVTGAEPTRSVPRWAPPGQDTPTMAGPADTPPWRTYPGQTPPGQTYPGQIPPVDTPPWQAYPGQTPPGQTYPGYPEPGYPGSGYSGPAYPGRPASKNGYAIASFIAGLLGLFGVSLIISIVFGIMALVQIHRRPQGGKGLAIAGLVLSGLWILVIGGLIAASVANQAQRSPSTGQVSHGGSINVFSLRVGDCFQNPTGTGGSLGVSYVSVVPCTTRHNAQMFAEFRVTGTSYPGRTSLLRQADQGCRARISGNLVKSKITSTMELHFLYPFAGSWADGHRTIGCLIVDSKPDLTSSLMTH